MLGAAEDAFVCSDAATSIAVQARDSMLEVLVPLLGHSPGEAGDRFAGGAVGAGAPAPAPTSLRSEW